MSDSSEHKNQLQKLHDEACKRGEHVYIDPETGYFVFTELKHLERGYCCDSGCRHCPYKNKQAN